MSSPRNSTTETGTTEIVRSLEMLEISQSIDSSTPNELPAVATTLQSTSPTTTRLDLHTINEQLGLLQAKLGKSIELIYGLKSKCESICTGWEEVLEKFGDENGNIGIERAADIGKEFERVVVKYAPELAPSADGDQACTNQPPKKTMEEMRDELNKLKEMVEEFVEESKNETEKSDDDGGDAETGEKKIVN